MVHNVKSIVIVMLVLLANVSCSDSGERGFKSSQPEFMDELKISLVKSGVPFREDMDGFIRYQKKYEDIVNHVKSEVEKEISGGIAARYDDKESSEYLKALLVTHGMKFRIEQRDGGEWIRWYPDSETRQKEIEMKVVEHNFDLQQKDSESRCKEEIKPSNNSHNKDATQTSQSAC